MTDEEIRHQIRFNQGCVAALHHEVRAVPIQRGTDLPLENGHLWLLGYDYLNEKLNAAHRRIMQELPEVGKPELTELINHCLAIKGPGE